MTITSKSIEWVALRRTGEPECAEERYPSWPIDDVGDRRADRFARRHGAPVLSQRTRPGM